MKGWGGGEGRRCSGQVGAVVLLRVVEVHLGGGVRSMARFNINLNELMIHILATRSTSTTVLSTLFTV